VFYLNKIFRLILIALVVLLVGWFGMHYGADRHSTAEAKIYDRLLNFTRAMPAYLFKDRDGRKPYRVVVNDNTTFLDVEKTNDDMTSVFNFYEEKFPPQPMYQFDTAVADDYPKAKKSLQAANVWLKLIQAHQHFRIERENYGFWGAFEFHDSELKIGSEAYYKKLVDALETGNIGELGIGRVVVALKDRGKNETTLIKMWTDRDFNFNNLLPGPDGDVAGDDIDKVPRYPGDNRIMSLAQKNRRTLDRIALYEGGGSVAAHVLFYHSRMPESGWKRDKTVEPIARKKADENLMFFTQKDREVTIQVRFHDRTGDVLTSVIERKPKG